MPPPPTAGGNLKKIHHDLLHIDAGVPKLNNRIRSHAHAVTDWIYCPESLKPQEAHGLRPWASLGFSAVNPVSYCMEGTSLFYFTTYYNKKNLSGRRPRCKNGPGGCINDRLRPEWVFFILLNASKQINKQTNKQQENNPPNRVA